MQKPACLITVDMLMIVELPCKDDQGLQYKPLCGCSWRFFTRLSSEQGMGSVGKGQAFDTDQDITALIQAIGLVDVLHRPALAVDVP